jgi:hypothetical protein
MVCDRAARLGEHASDANRRVWQLDWFDQPRALDDHANVELRVSGMGDRDEYGRDCCRGHHQALHRTSEHPT